MSLTRTFISVCLPLIMLSVVSCGPEALPKQTPEVVVGNSMGRAEKAVLEAQAAERAAEAKLQQSKQQLEEAHRYLMRAEEAASQCQGNLRRVTNNEIAKRKADEIKRKRAAAAEASRRRAEELKAKAEAELKAQEVVAPPPKKEPEYSPSDAP